MAHPTHFRSRNPNLQQYHANGVYSCPCCCFRNELKYSFISHMKNHFEVAVEHEGWFILKCSRKCQKIGHFHCLHCSKPNTRRDQFLTHLSKCCTAKAALPHSPAEAAPPPLPAVVAPPLVVVPPPPAEVAPPPAELDPPAKTPPPPTSPAEAGPPPSTPTEAAPPAKTPPPSTSPAETEPPPPPADEARPPQSPPAEAAPPAKTPPASTSAKSPPPSAEAPPQSPAPAISAPPLAKPAPPQPVPAVAAPPVKAEPPSHVPVSAVQVVQAPSPQAFPQVVYLVLPSGAATPTFAVSLPPKPPARQNAVTHPTHFKGIPDADFFLQDKVYQCTCCQYSTVIHGQHMLGHMETHFNAAVRHKGLIICRCSKPCMANSHFHCVYCNVTKVNKEDFTIHLNGHVSPATTVTAFTVAAPLKQTASNTVAAPLKQTASNTVAFRFAQPTSSSTAAIAPPISCMHSTHFEGMPDASFFLQGGLYKCSCCTYTVVNGYQMKAHIENHFNFAVNYKGLFICKCSKPCRPVAHFHCVHCMSTINKREAFVLHLNNHNLPPPTTAPPKPAFTVAAPSKPPASNTVAAPVKQLASNTAAAPLTLQPSSNTADVPLTQLQTSTAAPLTQLQTSNTVADPLTEEPSFSTDDDDPQSDSAAPDVSLHPSHFEGMPDASFFLQDGLHKCSCCTYTVVNAHQMKSHMENHFNRAVKYRGLFICKCNKPCRSGAHFHCVYCDTTVIRREQAVSHLKSHHLPLSPTTTASLPKPASTVAAPLPQLQPSTVAAPLPQLQPSTVATPLPQLQASTVAAPQSESAAAVASSISCMHPTHFKGRPDADFFLQDGLYNCTCCSYSAGNSLYKMENHMDTHFNHAVKHKGIAICICNRPCRPASHFHCLYCKSTITKRSHFIHHLNNHLSPHTTATLPHPAFTVTAPLKRPASKAVASPMKQQRTSFSAADPLSQLWISTADEHFTEQTVSSMAESDAAVACLLEPPPSVEVEDAEEDLFSEPPSPPDPAMSFLSPSAVGLWSPPPRRSSSEAAKPSGVDKVVCPQCRIRLNKKNLKVHIERRHSKILRMQISTERHLRCQCIDVDRGVFVVARTFDTLGSPLHVLRQTWDEVQSAMFCEAEECRKKFTMEPAAGAAKSNPKTFECPHLRSVWFCPAMMETEPLQLDERLLLTVEEKGFGPEQRALCLEHQRAAMEAGAPVSFLVDLPGPAPKKYLSVYEPAVEQYSRTGRVMVIFNVRTVVWHCPCAKRRQPCIHKYIAKWHMLHVLSRSV